MKRFIAVWISLFVLFFMGAIFVGEQGEVTLSERLQTVKEPSFLLMTFGVTGVIALFFTLMSRNPG